jgi:hypothetical protein
MHNTYAKDGLVCMSVSVDDKDDKDKTLAFLQKQHATFENYLIDEPAAVWNTKLEVAAPPAVLVFDRDGQRLKKFGEEQFTYEDVEKFVAPLLKEKK